MEDYRLDQSGQEVQDILDNAVLQSELTAETERATEAEQTLQGNIDAEATRAQGAEGTLQDNIDAEETRAKAAEKQNSDDIDAIEEKIPSGASSSNKLATEEYVADAVATATATFRGTYNLVSDLHLNVTATEQQISAALAGAISTADNNDYCFILVPTSLETPTEIKEIDRYKFNGTAWAFEYKLNNSGFTAAQWAAINSGITSGDVAKLAALPTNAQLTTLLAGLQSDIDGEETRAKGAEGTLQDNIDAEETRAKTAEKQNADDIDAIEAVIPESASSENKVATESEINSLSAAIEAILLLIPSAATSLNKLADKAFVNSSIATATATFRGTYNLVNDLGLTTSATHAQIATALAGAILTADNNDYAFVQIPTSDAMPTEIAKTERYKFNGTAWEYEYDLNNSGFTADQWAAINSGITQALVTKLSALPTNAELTTELGTLTSGINTINQKIPNAASQANKLVDTAAMESYIVQVLDVLTASFNVTSTDGHVTVQISQVDGKITSVAVSTSDIASAADLNLKASQADLTALASRVTTAEGNITTLGGRITTAEGNITSLGGRITTAEGNITSLGGRMTTAEGNITTINGNITSLGGRVSTNETDIANLQELYNSLQQSKPVPVDALPETGQQQGVIYRLSGTTSYSDYMWNGSTWVLMATYNNAIDPRPKKASQNLVTSGGVFDNMGALDVSELNATENPHTLAKYADLSAATVSIPTDYQKGGMSIKFVQSSDNKYVQYRLMNQNWSTTITDWQGVDDEPTAGSQNLVKSGGVAEDIINSTAYLDKLPVDYTENTFAFVISGEVKNASGYNSYSFACEKGKSYIYTGFNVRNVYAGLYTESYPEVGDVGEIIPEVNGVIKAQKNGFITIRNYGTNNSYWNSAYGVYNLLTNAADFCTDNKYIGDIYGNNIADSVDFVENAYYDSNQQLVTGNQSWKCAIIPIYQSTWLKKFMIDGVGNGGAVTSFLLNDGTIKKLTNSANPGPRLTLLIPYNAVRLYYSCHKSYLPYFEVQNVFTDCLLSAFNLSGIQKDIINFAEGAVDGYYSRSDGGSEIHSNSSWVAVKIDVSNYRNRCVYFSLIRSYGATNTFFELSDGTLTPSLGVNESTPQALTTVIPYNAVYLFASVSKNDTPIIRIDGTYKYKQITDNYPVRGSKRLISSGAVYDAINSINPIADLNLKKRKSVVSFIFDDSTENDPTMKQWCDDKGIKCGFAIFRNFERYKGYYDEGFSILAHESAPLEWTEQNLRQMIESILPTIINAGIDCKGWVTPSSVLPEQLRSVVYDYFEYGYTHPVGASAMSFSSKTYDLWRTNIDTTSEADCIALIDAAVANNQMVCFYSHTSITEQKFKSIVDYALAKSQVMAPDEAIEYFFAARHNEDFS